MINTQILGTSLHLDKKNNKLHLITSVDGTFNSHFIKIVLLLFII